MPGDPVFSRVLVKLSGESLMGTLDFGTDPERVRFVIELLGRQTGTDALKVLVDKKFSVWIGRLAGSEPNGPLKSSVVLPVRLGSSPALLADNCASALAITTCR